MSFICPHCTRNAFLLTTDSEGQTVVICIKCRIPLPSDASTRTRPQSRSGRERGRQEPMQLAAACSALTRRGQVACTTAGAGRKQHMNCTYCGYNSLNIVRDYTGAPYATCPRCYRSTPFYRTNSLNPPIEKTAAASQTRVTMPRDTGPGSMLEPSSPE